MAATPLARYRLLGRVEVTTEHGSAALSRAQRAVVAVLLLARGRAVPTDVLAEAVWADRQPSHPAAALRSQVARLRRSLGPSAAELETVDGGYRLSAEGARVDAACFERLVERARQSPHDAAVALLDEALGLWRGRALEEFADRPFAEADAVHLEELRLDAVEQRAGRLLALGRPAEAVAALQELLVSRPERERARELLMGALYRTGRHTEALGLYDAWRRYLHDELGLEPSPPLRQLEGEILRHSVVGAPRPQETGAAPAEGARLPRPVSTFVGRHHELAGIDSALTVDRLLTLVGTGGVGKTRLALEAASRMSDRYPDGVVFCDLAAVRRVEDVARMVASAVRLRERARRGLLDQLVAHLAPRRTLLVLDNCEHVLDGAAAVAERLTRQTDHVDVLATSRERLAADGEQTLVISPLAVGASDAPAVVLFVERARAVGRPPPATSAELGAVQELCRRLDGLPLAIELAAARSAALSIDDLSAGLARRFQLLDGGRRTSGRHRSLRAVIDWSYEQLSPEERHTFEHLCLLNGPFDLGAAAALVPADRGRDLDVATVVARLVERSLVARRGEGGANYLLLDTLRAYGVERLGERAALEAARARHARWVLAVVERAARGLGGPCEQDCVEELDRHADEMRAAHAWLVGNDVEGALRLAHALHAYAFWHGRWESFRWAQVTAAASGPSPLLASVAASACAGAWLRGDLPAAELALEAATAAARTVAPLEARRVVQQAGELALLHGRLAEAVARFGEAADLAQRAGDIVDAVWCTGSAALALGYGGQQAEAEVEAAAAADLAARSGSAVASAFAHFVLGEVAALGGSPLAEMHLRSCIERAESVGNAFIAGLARVTLATVASRGADPATALAEYRSVITTWQHTGAWTSQWVTLRNLAALLADIGAGCDAAVLYGAAVHATSGAPAYGRDQALLDELRRRLQGTLEPGELRRLIDEGRRLGDRHVVDFAIDAASRALAALPARPDRRPRAASTPPSSQVSIHAGS